ncbi:MAG: DUF4263 domain-containing protein [Gammaproteobacteria bacterium]|nr:DUF4263 domain-containing protein [Gammaproteobacteria bacterium]
MIRFETERDGPDLYLVYTPELNTGGWLRHQLEETGEASISARVFHVTLQRLVDRDQKVEGYDEEEFVFRIGVVSAGYYCIDRDVLGINFDLAIHVSIHLERKIFSAERNISIFRRLNDFDLESLTIGGDADGALPEEVFGKLLRKFPNSYELDRYAKARISSIIRNHLPIEQDFQVEYESYLNKKESHKGSQPLEVLAPYESEKFGELVEKMERMLAHSSSYTEKQWQDEILQIILLLFPRYIRAFKEGPVNDSWANKSRRVDFLLVDASGFIDVIEIKKPSDQHLVTSNRYRDNHVPLRELGGTIMQVEKYLYHFNRWGQKGEEKLGNDYASELPAGLEIKIVNPSGLIIMGRDKGLTDEQKNDFEVIRRKYRNILDIVTYDDLLRRLEVIRDHFQSRVVS